MKYSEEIFIKCRLPICLMLYSDDLRTSYKPSMEVNTTGAACLCVSSSLWMCFATTNRAVQSAVGEMLQFLVICEVHCVFDGCSNMSQSADLQKSVKTLTGYSVRSGYHGNAVIN